METVCTSNIGVWPLAVLQAFSGHVSGSLGRRALVLPRCPFPFESSHPAVSNLILQLLCILPSKLSISTVFVSVAEIVEGTVEDGYHLSSKWLAHFPVV